MEGSMDDRSMPRFNHVAMSVSRALLGSAAQGELLDFYGDVLGWTAMPTMSKPGELLVLRVHSNEQFVFLAASDQPMSCPETDHFGLSVADPEALYAAHARCLRRRDLDPGVEVVAPTVEDFGVLKLHSFYLGYRLPMRIEIQCFDWAKGIGAQSLPAR
jgi:hypothetical protein